MKVALRDLVEESNKRFDALTKLIVAGKPEESGITSRFKFPMTAPCHVEKLERDAEDPRLRDELVSGAICQLNYLLILTVSLSLFRTNT